MPIDLVHGDIFESRAQALVNPVNCVGVLGKGLAAEFARRFPAYAADYRWQCRMGDLRFGRVVGYRTADGLRIVSFPTKWHWRDRSSLVDIKAGLAELRLKVVVWGIRSMAVPALGCGLGGLAWDDVRPLLEAYLGPFPIPVELYEPRDG